MLQSFINKCDCQMLSDSISSYLTEIYKTRNIRSEDCVNLYNEMLSLPHNEWIKEICCNDVNCAAELLSVIKRTVSTPHYMIPDAVIKKSAPSP